MDSWGNVYSGLPGWPSEQPQDDVFEYIPPWTEAALDRLATWLPISLTEAEAALTPTPEAQRPHPARAVRIGEEVARCVHALWLHQGTRPEGGLLAARLPAPFRGLLQPSTAGAPPGDYFLVIRSALEWCRHRMGLLLGLPAGVTAAPGQEPHDLRGSPGHPEFVDVTTMYGGHIANRYDWDRPRGRPFSDAVARLGQELANARDILEIGPGTGIVGNILSRTARSYTGLEVSLDMAEIVRRRWSSMSHCRVIEGDAMRVPLPAASVDVVIEHEALCFVDEPLIAVDESMRVLRSGGFLVRLVSRTALSQEEQDLSLAFHTLLRGSGYPPFPIRGKLNDLRITEWLASRGVITKHRELASWTEQRSALHVIEMLANRGVPYLSDVSPEDARSAATKAVSSAFGTLDVPPLVAVDSSLTALVSMKP